MIKLIKLEWKKNNIAKYMRNAAILAAFLCLFVFVVHFLWFFFFCFVLFWFIGFCFMLVLFAGGDLVRNWEEQLDRKPYPEYIV